jgi:hypothetical protein
VDCATIAPSSFHQNENSQLLSTSFIYYPLDVPASDPIPPTSLHKNHKNHKNQALKQAHDPGSGVSQRWICVIMTFFSLFCAYTIRVCLSIAITEMVRPSNETSALADDTCPTVRGPTSATGPNSTTIATLRVGGTYDWSEYTQVTLTLSFSSAPPKRRGRD